MATSGNMFFYVDKQFVGNLVTSTDGHTLANAVLSILKARPIVNGIQVGKENDVINGVYDVLPIVLATLKGVSAGWFYLNAESITHSYNWSLFLTYVNPNTIHVELKNNRHQEVEYEELIHLK